MFAFLADSVFSVDGFLQLKIDPASDFKMNTRRLSRSATLDGGAVIHDGGYADGDRNIKLTVLNLSAEQDVILWGLFRGLSMLTISTADGCFLGYLESVRNKGIAADLSFMVKERLSQ